MEESGLGGGGGVRIRPRKLQTTMLYMKNLKTRDSNFRSLCVLCFQRQAFRVLFYFTAASVKCRVAAVKRLPILHRSADYNFTPFGIVEPILLWGGGRMQPRELQCCI